MSGHCRSIMLLLMLFLLAGANHSDAESERGQTAAQQSMANSVGNISAAYAQEANRTKSTEKQTAPCKRGNDRRYSDLCAKRKSADTAADSAWWAWAAEVAPIVSTIGVVVALFFAFWSNWIARDTARRELRAYLNIRDVRLAKDNSTAWCLIENSGSTPAYSVKIVTKSCVDNGTEISFGMLGPNTRRLHKFPTGKKIDLRNKADSWLVEYQVEYKDAFKRHWHFTWRYQLDPRNRDSEGMTVMHIIPEQPDERQIG